MKAALFATCLGDQFYADACADAVRLLRYAGVDVDVPQSQTCCGQPAYNAGRKPEAIRMAYQTLDTFDSADYVVLPSGSCAGMIRCFYPDLMNNELERAQDLAARTYLWKYWAFGISVLGSRASELRIIIAATLYANSEYATNQSPCSRTVEQRLSRGKRTRNAVDSEGFSAPNYPKYQPLWPTENSIPCPV